MVTQQRVELRFGTGDHKFGTVSKVFPDGSFVVSYDSYRDEKMRKVPGGRFTYPPESQRFFTVLHAA